MPGKRSAAPRRRVRGPGSAGRWRPWLWCAVVVLATAVLVVDRTDVGLDVGVVRGAAVAVTAAYAVALVNRVGGNAPVAGVLGLALGCAAQVSGNEVMRAGLAAATAVLAGMLAVVETMPARSVLTTVREVLVAVVLAAVGALAVAAYAADVAPERFRYVVVGAGVLGMLGLVRYLGAGLHGLGRRGAVVLVLGTVLLVGAVLYGEALGRWGSPDLVDAIDTVRAKVRDVAGAVPHPIEVLVGYPALVWGVFMRARRRQGWWVCAFGAAATISTASALVDPGVGLTRAVLGAAYSLGLGMVLGYLVIRVDLFVTGPRGRRARSDEAAQALRPEPGRTRSLR